MRAHFNRRSFLKTSLLIGTALSVHPWARFGAAADVKKENGSCRKKIIVIGAGLAGLSSAHVLTQAGYDVTICEARDRPGGRIETLDKDFSDGLYVEAGASFVSSLHSLTMKYIKYFNLDIEEVLPNDKALCYYSNKIRDKSKRKFEVPSHDPLGLGFRVMPNEVLRETPWPKEFSLHDREWQDGLYVFITKYCALGQLGDCADMLWPPPEFEKEDISFLEFLQSKENSASPAAIDLIRPWFAPWWDDINKVSALHLRRDAALGFCLGVREKTWYTIKGGMKRLPEAFAAELSGKIRYRTPVVEIKTDHTSAAVTFMDLETKTYKEIKGDHVICAIPFTMLREIKGVEHFSVGKQKAIRELPYSSIARVYLQCKSRRPWTDQNWKGVLYTTDLPIMNVMDSTFRQPGTRGILHAFMSGNQARTVRAKSQSERIQFAIEEMKKIYQEIEVENKHCTSKCWDEDEWSRGACAYFKPGQMHQLTPYIASPEGRVYFAGDHTSTWSGWMQGALQSGHRAACEVALAS